MLILLVVLLVFGAKRIPEIARGLGKGIREFKDATRDISRELNKPVDTGYSYQAPRPPAQPTAAPRPEATSPTPPAPDPAETPQD